MSILTTTPQRPRILKKFSTPQNNSTDNTRRISTEPKDRYPKHKTLSNEQIDEHFRRLASGEDNLNMRCTLLEEKTTPSGTLNIQIYELESASNRIAIGYKSSPRKPENMFSRNPRPSNWSGTYFANNINQTLGYLEDYANNDALHFYTLFLKPYSSTLVVQCSGPFIEDGAVSGEDKALEIKRLLGLNENLSLSKQLNERNIIYIGPSNDESEEKEILIPKEKSYFELEESQSYFIRPRTPFSFTLIETSSPGSFSTSDPSVRTKLDTRLNKEDIELPKPEINENTPPRQIADLPSTPQPLFIDHYVRNNCTMTSTTPSFGFVLEADEHKTVRSEGLQLVPLRIPFECGLG